MFGETAAERSDRERQEHLDKLHSFYGLTLGPANPTPVDKEISPADRASQAAVPNGQTAPDAAHASAGTGEGDPGTGEAEGTPQ
jgi:hypothetical protein